MKVCTFLASLFLLTACATAALADDKAQDNKNPVQAYLEKFGSPGPEHKLLAPLAGSWHADVKVWLGPSQTPDSSEGTVVRKSIMDGRFIQEDVEGKIMGKPFHGIGTIGYDRAKQKFVTTWIDSADTAIRMSYGTYDEPTKTWTFKQEGECPITGKHVKMRDTLRIVNANEQQLEMYRQLGDDKEVRTMAITLTRK